MKAHKLVYFLAGILVLSTSAPSTAKTQNVISHSNNITIARAERRAETKRSLTKTATISVEGEKTQVPLKLYSSVSPGFSTYYVENYFVPESGGSDEGTSVRFFVNTTGTKNQDAYVHFFFPARSTNLSKLRKVVNGSRGLLATNGWQVLSRTRNVPYRWAKERIDFRQRQGNQTITGSVFLGSDNGKAFYAERSGSF